ncbi:hypothetical protein [Fonticella tunisiensis]|nr:hypothetical protein [Fonticella tunisiensis]
MYWCKQNILRADISLNTEEMESVENLQRRLLRYMTGVVEE